MPKPGGVDKKGLTGRPRQIRRSVSEYDIPHSELVLLVFCEVMRMLHDGRVPDPAAEQALKLSLNELEDRGFEREVSWEKDAENGNGN